MTTIETVIIKRTHESDTKTDLELPQVPLDGDIVLVDSDDIYEGSCSGGKVELRVLNVRMRFDLTVDDMETEIVTELV